MSWNRKSIDSFCFVTDYVANGSFASLKQNVKYKSEVDYAILVRVTDFTKQWNGNYVWVDKNSYDFLNKSSLKPNDLIMANVGETGKCFIVPDLGQPMTLGPNSILIRPNHNVCSTKYLYYYFSSDIGQGEIKKISSATTQSKFNKTSFRKLEIPLPPLHIQKQIANTLDKADALRRKDQELLTKYDELAQAIFYDMFGDPLKNEKGWEVMELQDFGYWKSGGTPLRNNAGYYGGTIPWLSSGELESMYIRESKEKITKEALAESSTKLVPPFSLLLGMYDTAALKSSINEIELTCNQAIAFSKLDDNLVSTEYVYYYIQLAKEDLKRQQRGVRQKNMNLTMIKELKVLYPPLELQKNFSQSFKKIIEQKYLVECISKKSNEIFNKMLETYFS